MTLLELKEKADKLIARGHGDNTVVVPISGLSGSCAPVRSLLAGFDWHDSQAILNTDKLLSRICPHKHEKLMKLYLYEISNLRSIQNGKTMTARFKKEEKTFQKQFEAEHWLWESLRQALDDKK